MNKNTARLHAYLAEQAGAYGMVLGGLEALAQALKLNKRTVQRATATLERQGLITCVRLGDLHLYVTSPERVARDQLAQGYLEARILLSPTERDAVLAALGQNKDKVETS